MASLRRLTRMSSIEMLAYLGSFRSSSSNARALQVVAQGEPIRRHGIASLTRAPLLHLALRQRESGAVVERHRARQFFQRLSVVGPERHAKARSCRRSPRRFFGTTSLA